MAQRGVPYVLVPPSPWKRNRPPLNRSTSPNLSSPPSPRLVPFVFTRKRKPSRSPSPSESSSRSSRSNLSPRKKIRADEEIDFGLSELAFDDRPLSPAASDFYAEEDEEDAEFFSELDSTTDPSHVFLHFEEDADYVGEDQLALALGETPGRGLPIRRLHDFSLFKCENLELINVTELLAGDLADMYGASGIVECVKDEDSDSDSNSGDSDNEPFLRVNVLEIVRFNVHHFEGGKEVDENTYIETKDAWYILESPSELYRPFWIPFWIRHHFAHRLLTAAFEQPRTTYEEFVGSLDDSAQISELLTEDEFKSDEVVAYIMTCIYRVQDAGASIARVPLIRSFTDRPFPELPPQQRTKRPGTRKVNSLEKDAESFVTPVVGRVVMKHLSSQVSVVGSEMAEVQQNLSKELRKAREHHDDPESMHWGEKLDHSGFYSSVRMDGVTYKIGDVVAVAPGDDADGNRTRGEQEAAAHCGNAYANEVWFLQIMYFFDSAKGQKMFHGQWFTHGSRTILQEVTHTQELFLLHTCDDVPVAAIYQKCRVRFLGDNEVEEPDNFKAQTRDYFCQLSYDDDSHDFRSLPTVEERDRLNNKYLPAHKHCPSCGRKAEEDYISTVRRVPNGFALYNHVYHVGDFVYVKPDAGSKENILLFIAQIVKMKPDSQSTPICVHYYKRDADDPRRIYRIPAKNFVDVEDLDGPCFVRYLDPYNPVDQKEIETWVDSHPDQFYTNMKKTKDGAMEIVPKEYFNSCDNCYKQHCDELEDAKRLVRREGRVPVLEVFAGAGGLSQGLDQSGFFTTAWAVERSVPAAETFRSDADRTPILAHQIPLPGTVSLVCGGPPCQSFSGANSNKVVAYPVARSLLPFTMLSVAEIFQPDFFLLENVTGLLHHSVTDRVRDGQRVHRATLKLILRGLIALGYQASFKVLQAGQYGAPQGRQRVIFFGAKRGCKLPDWAIPTHAFPKAAQEYKLFSSYSIPPVNRGGPDGSHLFAPHASVTVEDAIGDLWINPHLIKPETAADVAERQERAARGIRQFDPSKSPVGFSDPVPYATAPQTRYQKAMRRTDPKTVKYHYTDRATSVVAELSASVPFKPSANHRDLPKVLLDGVKLDRDRDSRQFYFGRLDKNSYFKTAMTTVQPRARGSCVLHPTQKRPISVVEAKRCQGFPDDYVLWSEKTKDTARVKDYYRHVGNAVPVPLAAELGRSLERAFVQTWKERPRAASPEL
ncbi:S-adenosyl-L-methionine-dependent methyltransferase [Mycena galericulata]|nr:S-adenosyl-L-methionine-dependent methyltransferase [Mycena galericulata]